MKQMLLKYLIVTIMILVTFFSIDIKTFAASFKYSDFNWESFLEQNKNHWVSTCDKGDDNCYDRILKTQEKFYKRLYKLLAQYQRKGYTLDDNVIIATVFYGISPNSFKDPIAGEDNAYNLDEENDMSYIGEANDVENAKKYFENETDSLKILMNNMIGYSQVCYGVTDVSPTTDDNGNKSCGDYIYYDGKCVSKIDTFKSSFFESLGLGFGESENEKKCKELSSSFSDFRLGNVSSNKEVNIDFYWKFLTDSNYFDKKAHLQTYFDYILSETGHKNMTELNETEYKEYDKEIKKCRTRIINGIKSVVKTNERTASNVSMISGISSTYWWPIGSKETTDNNGILMASGEPESINISSYYGFRTDPLTLETNAAHHGVDITGAEGTNIIAARDGTIVFVSDANGGSCVNGDKSCGGGYGNYIIIQHVDNNYTLYAHLATNSITVKTGDIVKQGQVIGLMGSTGRSTGAHLHFEVRVGGNDSSSTQDPLLFIKVDNPRAVSVQSDLMEWIGVLEGTGPMEGDNYVVYNDSGGVATFGHGITVVNKRDIISSFGLNPDTLTPGVLVPKNVADDIYASIVQRDMDSIKSLVSAKGITLSDNQLAALVSLKYNTGNINDFFEPFNNYGSSSELCSNWWENHALHDRVGNYLPGLKDRRIAECEAFVYGNYNMNVYG